MTAHPFQKVPEFAAKHLPLNIQPAVGMLPADWIVTKAGAAVEVFDGHTTTFYYKRVAFWWSKVARGYLLVSGSAPRNAPQTTSPSIKEAVKLINVILRGAAK
jgi:hypothetical protein